MHVLSTEGNDDAADDDYAVHEANYISFEDYAQELAFLPDLTEPSVTELEYTAPNVKNSGFIGDQQRRLDEVLKKHEAIMILSDNGLPPPAYGVSMGVTHRDCTKKNGQDIRLCIDYKMVNAVTAIVEYAMPLVDDLLTELENYLWFCLLDAASGFEADRQASSELDPVLRMVNDPYADMFVTNEPDESSLVPVFQRRSFVDDICFGGATVDDSGQSKVDFLSHEVSPEGIRADPNKMTAITKLTFPKSKKGMQQFLGSLNYYSRFIQDFAVYEAARYQLKEDDFFEGGNLAAAKENFPALQRKVADAPILRHFDGKKEVHILLYANEWVLSATLMQIAVCGAVVTMATGGVREKDCVFTQLLQSTITKFVDLDDSLALVVPPTKGSPSTRLDPSLLYAQLPHDYEGFVVSFDGSAKTEKNVREYNAAADSLAGEALESKVSKVVLNDHRKTELKELNRIQDMIYEPSSDDIKVENASSETFAQIPDGKTYYIHAMDSDIRLQRKPYADFVRQERAEVSATTGSQTKTKKKRVHFEDEVHEGTTNTEATEATGAVNANSETQAQRPSAEVRHELTADDIDPVTVQKERRRRIAKAQDEEMSQKEQAAEPKGVNDDSPDDDSEPKSLFQPGSRVWLYMERLKPGLVKKLAHRWHGPFGVERKVEEFAYELELPDKSGYRFYPVVHVSRLKAVNEFCDRPKARLARDVAEEARIDFDEELLPEDSWMPDEVAGEFEVEAVLDDKTPMSTSTDRPVREFEVEWKSERRLQMVQVADED
ncbi:hypothetical protein PHMEG_00019409 [Phytophthora megakarya]|uniref:Tf2-1-like SH3-like domain-containing protein n=1 Tax=Phytophthora megakarya TaxID=4795 RepID=A0A225VRE4_9STRA|nr:hypothetical protein PHMEG_00019409 [Phytophthora megakarya]